MREVLEKTLSNHNENPDKASIDITLTIIATSSENKFFFKDFLVASTIPSFSKKRLVFH